MTTLREKVAAALCRFAFADKACRAESALCATCRGEAAAALAAVFEHLAEPTPAMLAALAREKRLLGRHLTIAQAWRAMLEAGLQP